MPNITPPSHHFTPQNLKYKVLYQEINSLLDYLIEKCYEPHVINMRDKLNPLGEGFDSEEFLRLVDGYTYKDLIFKNVNPRTVAVLLPRIYTLKGTKKGLKLLLNLLGIKADIYIWWEIIRNLQRNNAEAEEFRSKFGDIRASDIENCSIYLNYVDQLGSQGFASLLQGDIDIKLKELVTAFLWVCAFINVINILRELKDQLLLNDNLVHTGSRIELKSLYESYFWRSGVKNNKESDVIYNAVHKYNETGLEYRNPGQKFSVPGYEWVETEQRWISVGSYLVHYEDYSFSDSIKPKSNLRFDQSEAIIYLSSRLSIKDVLIGSSSTDVNMRTTSTLIDILHTVEDAIIRDDTDADKLLYDSKYHYNDVAPANMTSKTNDNHIAYDKPVTDKLSLTSTLKFTIEED